MQTILVRAALIASAGAAAIHLGAAGSHLDEYLPAGLFMIAAGLAQLSWTLWMSRRPSAGALTAGVAFNAAIALLWLVARTTGLPFGPAPWTPEDVHASDLLCTALEVLVVVAGLQVLFPSLPRSPRRTLALALAGSALSVVATGHDPLRERVVALAVLVLAGAVAGFLSQGPYRIELRPFWRRHARVALGAVRSGLDGHRCPVCGSGGPGAASAA